MSIILNIDTSSQQANVTLCRDGVVMGKVINGNQHEHASFLQPAIKQLLETHETPVHILDAIGVVNGPGSYTGLRVALASAKGLCYVLGKPLITINTLALLARSALLETAKTGAVAGLLCPMIDARRMEVYTTIYRKDGSQEMEVVSHILDERNIEDLFPGSGSIVICGDGAKKVDLGTNSRKLLVDPTIQSSAAHLIEPGYDLYIKGEFSDTMHYVPFYLKPPNITKPKDKALT